MVEMVETAAILNRQLIGHWLFWMKLDAERQLMTAWRLPGQR